MCACVCVCGKGETDETVLPGICLHRVSVQSPSIEKFKEDLVGIEVGKSVGS